jgi:hypothetical protein
VNEWQATALRHPCLLAEETAHPRFGHVLSIGTLVLTVNSGYE